MDLPTEPDGVRQLRDVTRAELAEHVRICRSLIDQLLDMVATGRLHPVEPTARPLDEAASVMSGLIDRTVTGKIVLTP